MGNRGVLHDGEGRILRAWQLKRWIVCVLEFRGRKRQVMTPGHYTELFFLDEATALAAGHRPCAECRHARFLDFCSAWGQANPQGGRSARPRPRGLTTGERLGLLASATVGDGGWVDLREPIMVRAGEAFIAVPEQESERE